MRLDDGNFLFRLTARTHLLVDFHGVWVGWYRRRGLLAVCPLPFCMLLFYKDAEPATTLPEDQVRILKMMEDLGKDGGETGSSEFIRPEALPGDLLESIDDLVCYLWDAEREDFAEHACGDHVFLALAAVHRWLYGHELTAEQLARGEAW